MKLGVLISGRGSNLEALLSAKAAGKLSRAEFALVASNNPDARGLDVAKSHGISTAVIDHREYKGRRSEHDRAIIAAMREAGCEAIVLAGYMRIIGPDFLAAYANRIINIHPALLPAFPGLHVQQQAIDYGVKVSGCTVHFVDEGTDTGPIILQKVVPVLETDNEDSLAARILVQEHQAIVEAVELLTNGCLQVQGRRVIVSPKAPTGV